MPFVSQSTLGALWESRNGPPIFTTVGSKGGAEYRSYLAYNNDGLRKVYNNIEQDESQPHHYVGTFVLSYFTHRDFALSINLGRDTILGFNPADIALGHVATLDAQKFREGEISMRGLADRIMEYKQCWAKSNYERNNDAE